MLEVLSPAGGMESMVAAVQSGANAIYMGYGNFNARRNAKNFSQEEFAAAVSYCHLRDTKVYLTMNTLITDREMGEAAKLAAMASDFGVDAILVQDFGVLRMLRQAAPDLPIHGSTQLTVHNLEGVQYCADMGMERVVLSRELSRDAIAHICAHAPIEIEVFGHGALCMCYSGQCFLSSMIGGRSGNRGLCAQPCRLQYGWADRADGHPLSLKDMSLAGHLQELEEMGVACIKLEGRMKRAEYVAIVTQIYVRAIREKREPTPEELRQLEAAFSRQGFTDGFYTGEQGKNMFGVREEQKREPSDLFAATRAQYEKETPRVPVTFYAMVRPNEPAQVAVEDDRGHVITAQGPVPELARNVALTAETVDGQLSKTGGTPYRVERVRSLVEPGLSLPTSALNALRRNVLEQLSEQRIQRPERRTGAFHPGARYDVRRTSPVLTMSLYRGDQLTEELTALEPAIIYMPPNAILERAPLVKQLLENGVTDVAVSLPRIAWDHELPALEEKLKAVRTMGVTAALVGNWGMANLAQKHSFAPRGDFGLGVYNTQTLKELKHLGFASATLSFELRLAQIRDISKAIDTELLVYGRLPLMIMENCIIKNRTGQCGCDNVNLLTDRTGVRFPVIQAEGCRNELLNAKKLFLADKKKEYSSVGLWGARLLFTTENPRECVQVAERYLDLGRYEPNDYTRGLYYREVE